MRKIGGYFVSGQNSLSWIPAFLIRCSPFHAVADRFTCSRPAPSGRTRRIGTATERRGYTLICCPRFERSDGKGNYESRE